MTKSPRSRTRSPPKTPAPSIAIDSVPISGTSKPHPEIGLGLWNLGRWTRQDELREESTASHAIEAGIRWLDTAEVYGAGRSERILGGVLARHAGISPEPFVASKVSWEHLRPAQVRAAIQGTLERLDRPMVDLYLVHAPDDRVPIADTMGVLAELAEDGRIGAIGVSNFTVPQLDEAQSALGPRKIAVNQIRYNLIDRDDGDELRDHCARAGVILEAYTPLAHGLLTGRFLTSESIPAANRRGSRRMDAEHAESTLAQVRDLATIAEKAEVNLAAVALHWVRRQGALPLFGASRPEQVDANLRAWATPVPDDVLDAADAVTRSAHD